MSLSPQNYEKSIGRSITENGSCLVYLDGNLIGEHPCGCDGWGLKIIDGVVYSDWHDRILYPPIWDNEKSRYVSGNMEESRLMCQQALDIIENYNQDRTY